MPPHPDRVRRNYTPEDFKPRPEGDPELTPTDDEDDDVNVDVDEEDSVGVRD